VRRLYQSPDVRLQLRREVNFGCAVCGSPYLKYHHFDPAYSESPHQNPAGMIALCATHSDFADRGRFSVDELRELKRNPFLSSPEVVARDFGWLRNELILLAGGFYVNPRVFLRLEGRDIIWFNRDEDSNLLMNLDIRDATDRPVILMEDNDWLEIGAADGIDDIRLKPGGYELTVRASQLGVFFSIRFRNFDQQTLKNLGEEMGMRLEQRTGPQGPVGPFGEASSEDLRRIIEGCEPGPQRESLLMQIELNRMIARMPTRWDILTQNIHSWPVTVCTVKAKLEHPCRVYLSPGQENVAGWRAGHTIGVESAVVWDVHCGDH
jgi:hypothetical protein